MEGLYSVQWTHSATYTAGCMATTDLSVLLLVQRYDASIQVSLRQFRLLQPPVSLCRFSLTRIATCAFRIAGLGALSTLPTLRNPMNDRGAFVLSHNLRIPTRCVTPSIEFPLAHIICRRRAQSRKEVVLD